VAHKQKEVIKLKGKTALSIALLMLIGAAIAGGFGTSTFAKGTLTATQTNAVTSAQTTAGPNVQEQYPNYTASITVPQNGDDANLASLAKITADQAKSAAATHLSASAADVKSVSLENENGNLVYSVQILKQGIMHDVKVDAGNGTVLFTEQGVDGAEAMEGVGGIQEIED